MVSIRNGIGPRRGTSSRHRRHRWAVSARHSVAPGRGLISSNDQQDSGASPRLCVTSGPTGRAIRPPPSPSASPQAPKMTSPRRPQCGTILIGGRGDGAARVGHRSRVLRGLGSPRTPPRAQAPAPLSTRRIARDRSAARPTRASHAQPCCAAAPARQAARPALAIRHSPRAGPPGLHPGARASAHPAAPTAERSPRARCRSPSHGRSRSGRSTRHRRVRPA